MLAFHNDPKIRRKYTDRVRRHKLADEIIKGQYWEDGKGCAVGCILHSSNHAAAENEIGVPTWLMLLIDGIFENLPNSQAKEFPSAFLAAIPMGADLAPVRDKFLAWLMEDTKYGLAHVAREQEIKDLAAEVGKRLRTGEGVTGAQALWAARAARAARAAWDARDAFVLASRDKLLELLRATKP